MTYETQWRATYEDTKNHQEELRKKINELIKENRPVKNEEERTELFELLDDSTFGLGSREVSLWLPNKRYVTIPDLQKFIRCLIDYTESYVNGEFFFEVFGLFVEHNLEIKTIWRQVKFHLYSVFSNALETAVKMSKEQKSGFGESDVKEAAGFG